jgi:hypothetical protein
VLLGQRPGGRHIGDRRLYFVLPPADNVALTFHKRLESCFGDHGGVILFFRSHLGIEHIGPREEFGLGGARHQARDTYLRFAQFLAKCKGERIQVGLGSVVDGLETSGRKSGNRARDQDAALIGPTHITADFMEQISRAGHVGVNDFPDPRPFLVQERMP